jgi:hypothetical protein
VLKFLSSSFFQGKQEVEISAEDGGKQEVESIERASKTDEIMACQSPKPLTLQVRWKISVLGHWYSPVHWHWIPIEGVFPIAALGI